MNCGLAGFEKEERKEKKGRKKRVEEVRKEKSQIKIPKEKPKLQKNKSSCIFFFFTIILKKFEMMTLKPPNPQLKIGAGAGRGDYLIN